MCGREAWLVMEDVFSTGASVNVTRAGKKSNFFNDGDVKSRNGCRV